MKIVIIGTGTAAITTADILVQDHNFSIEGFVDVAEQSLMDVSSGTNLDGRITSDLSRFHKLRFERFLDGDR